LQAQLAQQQQPILLPFRPQKQQLKPPFWPPHQQKQRLILPLQTKSPRQARQQLVSTPLLQQQLQPLQPPKPT
jgi:hypothetical protein